MTENLKKILIVDDDPFILDIYSSQLKRDGYRIDIAPGAKMAMEKLQNNQPDLLVLDLNLDTSSPGPKDGLEILRALRQNPKTKSLKVIIFSNYNASDYPELAELDSLGIERVFSKVQIVPDDMVKAIKEIFK